MISREELLSLKDEMTSRERSEALARGEAVDRIPLCPILGETMGPLFGIWPREHNHNAELMTQVEVGMYREFGVDGAGIGTGLRGVAEAMGVELVYPEKAVSYVKEPLVKTEADVAKLKPCDPEKDGRLPIILKALDMINAEVGAEVGVSTDMAGPLTVVAQIMEPSLMLRWMVKKPDLVHEILHVVTESNKRFIDSACKRGYAVGFSDPLASQSLLSVKMFREFVKPYLAECIEEIKKWRGNEGINLHICGKSSGIWNDMADLGINTLSIDNVDSLAECREKVGDRACLVGNVPPVDALRMGDPEMIINYCIHDMAQAWDNPGGYVLSTGCQIPIGTPRINVEAFMYAGRKYGAGYKYPKFRKDENDHTWASKHIEDPLEGQK